METLAQMMNLAITEEYVPQSGGKALLYHCIKVETL